MGLLDFVFPVVAQEPEPKKKLFLCQDVANYHVTSVVAVIAEDEERVVAILRKHHFIDNDSDIDDWDIQIANEVAWIRQGSIDCDVVD